MIIIEQKDLREILKYSTEEKQVIKCIEELSELQKELCYYLNYGGNIGAIMEEIADVLITVDQMQLILLIDDVALNNEIKYKISRTLARLRNCKKEESE